MLINKTPHPVMILDRADKKTVLAAMGVLPCERTEVIVDIKPLDSALTLALSKAGL